MRGRKPKPTAIKLLEGNPGKRALNHAEPKPRVVLPRPPEHLSDEEKAKWKSTVKELYPLGLITAVDKDQLAMYCVVFIRWVKAEKVVREKGEIIKTAAGNIIQNPYLSIANRALYPLGWNLRHVRHWLKDGQVAALSAKADMIDEHSEFIGAFEHDEGRDLSFTDALSEGDVQLLETYYHRAGRNRGREKAGKAWALRSYWNDIKGTASAHGHVAAFPLEIPARHILMYTKPDEIVFEPFAGAGTTLIACEILNRVCYAVEIDPAYVAASLERWQLMTGETPVVVETAVPSEGRRESV